MIDNLIDFLLFVFCVSLVMFVGGSVVGLVFYWFKFNLIFVYCLVWLGVVVCGLLFLFLDCKFFLLELEVVGSV